MQSNSFKSVNGNPEFTFYDTHLEIGNGYDKKSLNYGVIQKIALSKSPSDNIPGIVNVVTLSNIVYYLYFEEKDLGRIETIIAEVNKKLEDNYTKKSEISSKVQNKQYESKSYKSEVNNSKSDTSSGNGCLVAILVVALIIAVFLFKGCVSLFSSSGSWDSDDDGLSDSFEREQGTDPNNYTWNWELHD